MQAFDIQTLADKLDRPVALIGMMGSGKTTLGKTLAETLGRPFYDSDKLIEEKAGMPTADIFDSFGEAKFRDVEEATICMLAAGQPSVIATGGGAVMREATLKALLKDTIVIWMDAPVDVLWERLKGCTTRPLLRAENPQEKLRELLAQREKYYAKAHIRIPVQAEPQTKALEKMILALAAQVNSAKT